MSAHRILPTFFLLFLLACGGREGGPRVLILGLDGLDPRAVDLLVSEGKMPHFARLRREGAYGRLLSQEPMLSPILWTTIATGKTPDRHGIGHFTARDPSTGEDVPVTSSMRRVKALWNLASEAGREVAVVGWWATWPPEEVRGAIVSDHTAYHFLFDQGFDGGGEEESKTHPPGLLAELAPLVRRPEDLSYEELRPFADVHPEELARPFSFDDELAHFKWAYSAALTYRDIGLELWRRQRPDLAMVYIEGTDSSSHLFGHLFRAEGLAGELAEQQRRFGRTVEEMYLFADRLLGEYLEAMDERTTLLVLSDHGFDLGTLHEDPSRARDLRRVSERFHSLEGVLYMLGPEIAAGGRLAGPTILDITPTVLTLLGLPVAGDMQGRVLAEAFREPPRIENVATYEGDGDGHGGRREESRAESHAGRRDPAADRAMVEHLRSLGYLGGGEASSPRGDRNLAAIHFQAGRYREAARIYLRLVEESPEDAALRTSLAGALGALERYEEALAQLERAIELSPIRSEAYHNRAVLHERRGDVGAAVADYREALRYQPAYEPSRRALLRLTGSAEARPTRTEAEERAFALAERAGLAARRGDSEGAMALLDEAAAIAPEYALLYQYRSNVAYLMGDIEAAIRALEKGLELEPDNALFRENLKRLGKAGGSR